MSPTDKLVLPDDKTLQPEAGGTTITIRVSRESRRRLAAAAERSGASVEAVAEWFLEWTLLDERQKKRRGRPGKARLDRLYDQAVDLLLVTEVSRRPKGKISQTIKHLEKREPFKRYKDLRSRYNKEAKRLRDTYGLTELPRDTNGQEGWNMGLRKGGELHHPQKVVEAIDALRQDSTGLSRSPPKTKKEWADALNRREKVAWFMEASGHPLPAEPRAILDRMKKSLEDWHGPE